MTTNHAPSSTFGGGVSVDRSSAGGFAASTRSGGKRVLLAQLPRTDAGGDDDVPPVEWDSLNQGSSVLCMVRDPLGCIWIGTEDHGVWRLDPRASLVKRWKNFTTRDGLGDDGVYSLACDQLGRVWAGHLNHGVSVYNGTQWRNYDAYVGPAGSHVCAMAVCPTDGDIWMATEHGISRYSSQQDRWSSFTVADGLPSNQVDCLAFDRLGNCYAGTLCDGIAIGSAASGYTKWVQVKAPDPVPALPWGNGLCGNLINCILATRGGVIFVGTNSGMARSQDGGATWRFVRGIGWDSSRNRAAGPVLGAPPARAGETDSTLLLEDYVSALAEDDSGRIWIGHRETDYEVIDARGRRVYGDRTNAARYVRAFVAPPDGPNLVGCGGAGLITGTALQPAGGTAPEEEPPRGSVRMAPGAGQGRSAPFPSAARPPKLADLNTRLKALGSVPTAPGTAPFVVAMDDDWRTQGDWLGRYGRYWGCLCGMCAPEDYITGCGWEKITCAAQIGSVDGKKPVRRVVRKPFTGDRGYLELPPGFTDLQVKHGPAPPEAAERAGRRFAQWDDQPERGAAGPEAGGLYCTVAVPTGLFYLSLYEVGDARGEKASAYRDCTISVKLQAPGRGDADSGPSTDTGSSAGPAQAYGRARDFAAGVYKRFLLRGPAMATIQVLPGGPHGTVLAAVMLDLVDECPPPYFDTTDHWGAVDAQKEKDALSQRITSPGAFEADATNRLFEETERTRYRNPAWWAVGVGADYGSLLLWYGQWDHDPGSREAVNPKLCARIGSCCYCLGLYSRWEDCQQRVGLVSARTIENAVRYTDGGSSGEGYRAVAAYFAAHQHGGDQGSQTSR